MSIIWQGQHITGSPYTITVDTSVDAPDVWQKTSRRAFRRLKRADGQDLGDESNEVNLCPESARTVVKRKRILRYIVKIEGKDVVIDGKEDLCEAISRIKEKMRKASSSSEESIELNSEWPFKKQNEDGKKNFDPDDETCYEFSAFSNTGGKPNTDLVNGVDPVGVEMEEELRQDSVEEEWNVNFFDSYDTFPVLDEKTVSHNKDLDCYEHKSEGEIFQLKSVSADGEVLTRSLCDELENLEIIGDVVDGENMHFEKNLQTHKHKEPVDIVSKGNFIFYDDTLLESESSDVNDNCSNNDAISNVNSDACLPSTSDDHCFFPVHKVQYGMIHDEEEDTDDYSSKRSESFSELPEPNYQDEAYDKTREDEADNISSSEDIKDIEESCINSNLIANLGTSDIGARIRANHELFHCDHSFDFWSENVNENATDFDPFEVNTLEIIPENNSGVTENNLPEKPFSDFFGMSPFDSSFINENNSLGFNGKNPFENGSCEFKESDFFNFMAFSQHTDINKWSDDIYFEMLKKSFMREGSECKKRVSWPGDILPSIRESSFEGVMDLETHHDKIRNQEVKEIKSSSLSPPKTQSKFDHACADDAAKHFNGKRTSEKVSPRQTNNSFSPLERHEKVTDTLNDNQNNEAPDKSEKVAEKSERKTPISPKLIISSPLRDNTQAKKCSEIRFTTCTYLERNQTRVSPPKEHPTTNGHSNASRVSDALNSYILTYATPIMIGDSSVSNSEKLSKSDSDESFYNADQEPDQCLSVKQAVQIFQQENDESVDALGTETQPFRRSYRKTNKDSISKHKFNGRSEFSESSESDRFSPSPEQDRSPRSSIRHRAKMFEIDENKNSLTTTTTTKPKNSPTTISKKVYWENF